MKWFCLDLLWRRGSGEIFPTERGFSGTDAIRYCTKGGQTLYRPTGGQSRQYTQVRTILSKESAVYFK